METHHEDARRRFTVSEVMEMVRAGILADDDHVELIDGELLVRSPNDPRHAGTTTMVGDQLEAAYSGVGHVRTQMPAEASDTSLPEPDLAVVRGDARAYLVRHPRGVDCVLVVEVSSPGRRRDIHKALIYAQAAVSVYWRLDVETRRLEVYRDPKADGVYAQVRILEATDEVELPELAIRWKVADLLP